MPKEFLDSQSTNKENLLPQGRLDQTLVEYFKENKIEMPPIETTMLFSRHYTASDVEWMEPHYKETDIFIPETVSWTPEGLEMYQKIAQGGSEGYTASGRFFSNLMSEMQKNPKATFRFSGAIVEMMQKFPGKKICYIDLPAGTELQVQHKKDIENLFKRIDLIPPTASLAERAEIEEKLSGEFSKSLALREEEITKSLPRELGKLVKQYPGLLKKEKLKVLIQLGSNHTRIYQWLKSRGENVSRFFPNKPYNYMGGLHSRADLFGKSFSGLDNKKITFADTICFKTFLHHAVLFIPEGLYSEYVRRIVALFSEKEMEEVYAGLQSEDEKIQNEAQNTFEHLLQKNKIPIVKNRMDIPILEKYLQS